MASLAEKRALVAQLQKPPIIEAVLDIDCDMPPNFDLAALRETSLNALGEHYPVSKKHFVAGHQLETKAGEPLKLSVIRGLQSLRFSQNDGLQIVQLRPQGFSFNRLAPYASLDTHLPEIERTYRIFLEIAKPVLVRRISLRYINKILLPFRDDRIELEEYLEKPPRLPRVAGEERFHLRGFLHHDTLVEVTTQNEVNRVLTLQPPEKDLLPLIFDNSAIRHEKCLPDDWLHIRAIVLALRSLKNEIFADTLTEGCLRLFQ